jgi:hypothetical protein
MEAIYETMNEKNIWYKTKPVVNSELSKGRCVAVYSLGDWYLQPSFQRLVKRLKSIVGDKACFYNPVPYQSEGLLHQTLLQFIKFGSYPHAEEILLNAMKCVSDVTAQSNLAVWIHYKGLVWTPTGVALAGYCDDEQKVLRVRQEIQQALESHGLPCEIPYTNDILHTTLFRWTSEPTGLELMKLEKEINRWSECFLGELRVNQWRVGKASWRMRHDEREDYFEVPVYQHICHRGNISGPIEGFENNFGILIQRTLQGNHVEVDVWFHENHLWLGHDKPEYKVSLEWLASCKRRLIHAKDGKTFEHLIQEAGKRALDLHIFYHTDEDYVLTNKGLVICYPGKPLLQGSLCMMPERSSYKREEIEKCFSVCTDSKNGISSHSSY